MTAGLDCRTGKTNKFSSTGYGPITRTSYIIDHSEQERIRRAIKGLEITVRQFSLQNLLGDKPAAFPDPSAKSAVGTPPKTWPARTRAIAATTPNSIFAAVVPPRSSVVEAA